jgi:signal transduction histidine kinase
MLLGSMSRRDATVARLVGLALILWSVTSSNESPAFHGRGLLVLVVSIALIGAWLLWTLWSSAQLTMTPDLYVIGFCAGFLTAAVPDSVVSAGGFVAAMAAATRINTRRAFEVIAVGDVAMGAGLAAYHGQFVVLLAYTGGWVAVALAGTNIRSSKVRAEQAELLLVQSQRSHEEQLRATIQLEATTALLDQGANPESIRDRVERAHQLAREGLRETRRAVGALRGDAPAPVGVATKALVDDYRAEVEAAVEFALTGEPQLLDGVAGEAVLRVVQEALTNVHKHAPGAQVSVSVVAGPDRIGAVVEDRQGAPVVAGVRRALKSSGGGYGLRGMRERAELLGGTLEAGPTDCGWRVELHLPLDGHR